MGSIDWGYVMAVTFIVVAVLLLIGLVATFGYSIYDGYKTTPEKKEICERNGGIYSDAFGTNNLCQFTEGDKIVAEYVVVKRDDKWFLKHVT